MSVKFQAPEVYEHFMSLKSLFIIYKYVLSNHQLCLPNRKRVKIKETMYRNCISFLCGELLDSVIVR